MLQHIPRLPRLQKSSRERCFYMILVMLSCSRGSILHLFEMCLLSSANTVFMTLPRVRASLSRIDKIRVKLLFSLSPWFRWDGVGLRNDVGLHLNHSEEHRQSILRLWQQLREVLNSSTLHCPNPKFYGCFERKIIILGPTLMIKKIFTCSFFINSYLEFSWYDVNDRI